MKSRIQAALHQLEAEQHIKVLYAAESGSRAWGFASTDSDWDVRFIYVHHPDWYLSIDTQRDSLERMLPQKLDLAGWELRKTLRLFRKSNPSLQEWLRSSIIYLEPYATARQLRELAHRYVHPKACLYHYLHMAEGNYLKYLQGAEVRLKRYFYVLRPLLACKWIERHGSMGPIEFQSLLDAQTLPASLRHEIDQLLARKRAGEELNYQARIQPIHAFVEQEMAHFKAVAAACDHAIVPKTSPLNDLFRATLEEVWA